MVRHGVCKIPTQLPGTKPDPQGRQCVGPKRGRGVRKQRAGWGPGGVAPESS